MSLRENQFRTKNIRKSAPGKYPNSKESRNVKSSVSERLPKFNFNTDKVTKILGLFSLLLSLYFLIAFTSYLFTWQDDQSYISSSNGGWGTLFKSSEELRTLGFEEPIVDNWLGKFGALLSHQFIYKWFGIASFIFVAVLFVIGYRLLFKVLVYHLNKTFGYSIFFLLFISTTIAYFHGFASNLPHFIEGEIGFWSNRLLQAQIGRAGVGGLLLFSALTFLVIVYNLDFKFLLSNSSSDIGNDELEEQIPRPIYVNRDIKAAEVELDPRLNIEKEAKPKNNSDSKIPSFEIENREELPIPEAPPKMPINELVKPSPALSVEDVVEEKKADANVLVEKFGQYDPKLDLSSYKYPHLGLLKDYGTGKITINNYELEANKDKIVDTLGNYNIEIEKIKATIGPTVTLYEIIPKPGVRISKIKNLEDDIALSLAALGIRIIAPMPGKGTIGIEVPNSHPEMVSMYSVLATEKFQHTDMDLPIALGKTISNEVYIADLAKMPHLLVAGATGQGKSVGINAILTSLLFKKHPSELKFVLVDPKKVELSLFRKIERHFLAKLPGEEDAIITDTKKVINTLNSLCIEMDQRYDLLKNGGVRNLKEYNVKFVNRRLNPEEGHRFLPFIVLVVDEFADLMMTAGKEVETPIARLAQLARAVGIHLVIATQRPSVNIITGTIKANFPARLAFRVLSKVDSRTILDSGGADQLIGRGDMLLSTGSELIRIQCAFVDTPEVDAISDFIGEQRGYPSAFLLPEYVDESSEGSSSTDFSFNDRDALFEDAARLIVAHQQGSTSLIQRRMKLGYNRAGRIIDQLESVGIVGPFEGSKAREVLYPDEYSLEQYLDTLKKND
jgi:S-DNA-T family DNA segregation ATPase FtsK/SpoIIIE